MSFVKTEVNLTKGQMKSLRNAIEKKSPVNIKFSATQLKKKNGLIPFMVTKTQFNNMNKAFSQNKGLMLKLSKRQIMAMKKDGGILPLLVPVLTAVGTAAVGAITGFAVNKALTSIDKAVSGGTYGEGICTSCNGSGLAPFGTGLKPFGTGLKPFGTGMKSKKKKIQPTKKLTRAQRNLLMTASNPQKMGSGLFPIGVRPRRQ